VTGHSEWAHGKPKPKSSNNNKKAEIIRAIAAGGIKRDKYFESKHKK